MNNYYLTEFCQFWDSVVTSFYLQIIKINAYEELNSTSNMVFT